MSQQTFTLPETMRINGLVDLKELITPLIESGDDIEFLFEIIIEINLARYVNTIWLNISFTIPNKLFKYRNHFLLVDTLTVGVLFAKNIMLHCVSVKYMQESLCTQVMNSVNAFRNQYHTCMLNSNASRVLSVLFS